MTLREARSIPLARMLPFAVPPIAIALWAVSLGSIDQRAMTDLGLISVLPPATFAALALLIVSFCVGVRSARTWLLFAHVVALIVMLYGITPLIDEVPRYTVSWRHMGVTEAVMRVGDVDPRIDAYFNWPGFFIFSSFLAETSAISLRSVVDWAPVFYNFLYLAPLLVIARSATRDERLVWSAIWVFYLTNWIGQDYFSPQGQMFFLYLVVIAVILRWFVARRRGLGVLRRLGLGRFFPEGETPSRAERELSPLVRAGLMAIVVVIFTATVPSHQLTPFVALASIGALVFANRCPARSLPILIAVLAGTWMCFAAVAYLGGHIEQLTGGVGKLDESAEANVGSRLRGSLEHVFVVYTRLALTAAVWGAAVIGALRMLWRRETTLLPLAALAAAPFPLLPIQPYGGEMLMRVYLFTLPFMAFAAAGFFFPRLTAGRSRLVVPAMVVASFALLGGFFVARYGNERMDFYTSHEAQAVDRMYELAPEGSLLLAGSGNLPWKAQGYELYDYAVLSEHHEDWNVIDPYSTPARVVLRNAERVMAKRDKGAYVIFTRSQKAEVDLMGLAARGYVDEIEAAMRRSPRFRLLYENRDASIFTLARRGDA